MQIVHAWACELDRVMLVSAGGKIDTWRAPEAKPRDRPGGSKGGKKRPEDGCAGSARVLIDSWQPFLPIRRLKKSLQISGVCSLVLCCCSEGPCAYTMNGKRVPCQ